MSGGTSLSCRQRPKKRKKEKGQIGKFKIFEDVQNLENFEIPEFDVSDIIFGFPALSCVGSADFRRKISILDDFGAKRKKEGLPAAKDPASRRTSTRPRSSTRVRRHTKKRCMGAFYIIMCKRSSLLSDGASLVFKMFCLRI